MTQKKCYTVECPECKNYKDTVDMQEAHDWARKHRYIYHKGMTASDMPVTSL